MIAPPPFHRYELGDPVCIVGWGNQVLTHIHHVVLSVGGDRGTIRTGRNETSPPSRSHRVSDGHSIPRYDRGGTTIHSLCQRPGGATQ